jgi:thiol-disulfide isomerase/thioredoxin
MPILNELRSDSDFQNVFNKYNTIVLDFYMPSCGPCKTLTSLLETNLMNNQNVVNKINNGELIFLKVNVTDPNLEDLVDKYKVNSVPSVFVYKGNETYNPSGSAEQILNQILRII